MIKIRYIISLTSMIWWGLKTMGESVIFWKKDEVNRVNQMRMQPYQWTIWFNFLARKGLRHLQVEIFSINLISSWSGLSILWYMGRWVKPTRICISDGRLKGKNNINEVVLQRALHSMELTIIDWILFLQHWRVLKLTFSCLQIIQELCSLTEI